MFDKTTWMALASMLGCTAIAWTAEPPPSARDHLKHFSQHWREDDWQQKGRSSPGGYMRPLEDDGWQARMRALQGCVRHDGASIAILLDRLRSGDAPERILAAQTLGYLGPDVPAAPLVAALKSDTDPAVRLYLVDTLGMLGKGAEVDWDAFLKDESNRDVKRHVGYVRERNERTLDTSVVRELTQWDSSRINTATVGRRAPDFTLSSVQGETVRLSDFRGKKAVVLVFIYGDT